MGAVEQVTLTIGPPPSLGAPPVLLRIAVLPERAQRDIARTPLLDLREDPERDAAQEPVQLLEGSEYLYEFLHLPRPDALVTTDREELFRPDTRSGHRGRLRTAQYTGTLTFQVFVDQQVVGQASVEVRSWKLDYPSHYRWMLRDIATLMTELLMERFAPTSQRFTVDEAVDARTIYQRFAFLRSLLLDEGFTAAVQHLLARPYVTWDDEEEAVPFGRGLRGSSQLARQLSAAGPRVAAHGGAHLPRTLHRQRTEATVDNLPNRFVKYALTQWRQVIAQLGDALAAASSSSAPVRRGLREVEEVLTTLDTLLAADLFREVGALQHLDLGSQVLQKREGYRAVLRAYLLFEAAARLSWQGGEDVYGAGQRDVATLYEFWAFLTLAQVLAAECGVQLDRQSLVQGGDGDELSVGLRRGQAHVLHGELARRGRRLRVELWFNRSFAQRSAEGTSWSCAMRPDCAIRVQALGGDFDHASGEVWLHFDAKYRLNQLTDIFGEGDGQGAREAQDERDTLDDQDGRRDRGDRPARSTALRVDLLKMHAYRDAIHRSAGAYVLYPGDTPRCFPAYHEILPGLGAFALRPTEGGEEAEGARALGRFLSEVFDHLASQFTQHERSRYWIAQSFHGARQVGQPAAALLQRPPADTMVLVGYVRRGERHLRWIQGTGLYNLRAGPGPGSTSARRGAVPLDSAKLHAHLVLLYGADLARGELRWVRGVPLILTQAQMREEGYPDPSGEVYFCYQLGAEAPLPDWIETARIDAIRQRVDPTLPRFAPFTLSWERLAEEMGR